MGTILGHSKEPIATTVQQLLDYAGTTAAGIQHLKNSNFHQEINNAILAAYSKAKKLSE